MMKLWNEFDRMVVFDTETTGIEFDRDRIIEIGAVALKEQGESGDFNALIRLPEGRTLPPFITQLTGITDEQLAREGVDDRTAAEGFCRLLEGAERPLLVAYNEQEQKLLDDYKRTKAKLTEIEDALAAIQIPHAGKRLAKSNTNHLA